MSQRTILLLGGSMSGIRLPATDIPGDGVLVIAVPVPAEVVFREERPALASALFEREIYRQVRFGLIETEMMVLDRMSPDRALGQYLRGEPVR